MKTFAKFWLIFFILSSLVSFLFHPSIQKHDLAHALHFGFDPFGRNCLLLSLNAFVETWISMIPLGLIGLLVSLILSSLILIQNRFFQFFWNSFWETIYSLPGFVVAISIAAYFPDSKLIFPVAIGLLLIPYLIRYFEGQIQTLMTRDYVLQSTSMGATRVHLFKTHALPELRDATFSILPFLITRLMIIETSLSFVGLKQPGRITTWGELLYQGKDYLLEAPWISFSAAIPLFLTLFSFHLISRNEPS